MNEMKLILQVLGNLLLVNCFQSEMVPIDQWVPDMFKVQQTVVMF